MLLAEMDMTLGRVSWTSHIFSNGQQNNHVHLDLTILTYTYLTIHILCLIALISALLNTTPTKFVTNV